jgi:diguanylate cyclase (GGDEF)-like protein
MSDHEAPRQEPENGDAASASSAQPSPDGALVDAPTAAEPTSPTVPSVPAGSPAGHAQDEGTPPRRAWSARRAAATVVATVCLAAGVIASILGAHTVARNDARTARASFHQSSGQIASALKLALQHEEDLQIAASTFLASNPDATGAEFHAWAKWAHASSSSAELQELRLIKLVPARGLASFVSRGIKPAAAGAPRIVPVGSRPSYCLALAGLGRGALRAVPAGLDYCARTPRLLASRETGRTLYTPVAAGTSKALAIQTPVYRGETRPVSALGRRAAFAGWVRQVIVPDVVLAAALRGEADAAARLRYRASGSTVVFTSGTPVAGAQARTFTLRDGWTLKSFGPTASASIGSNSSAQALLIGGCVVTALIALLILLLGSGGQSSQAARVAPAPSSGHEDLYDPLTGLPNRGLTLDLAERMLARTGRQSGVLAGALIVDIDWFKDVNDKLGTPAGDQLLVTVAERLGRVVRAQDTVGRLEDDRFVVLVESAARGVRLDSLARRVIEAMHKPVELDGFGPSFFITASIGIAYGQYTDTGELLHDARLAMTAAKAAGKDGYTVFNANMRSVIEGRGVLEAELNTALQDSQFFLLYQPIRDLASSKVVGLEALIRWQHPKRGVVSPDEFIPLAEETGLIVPIGRWVLDEACARAAACNVGGPRVGISVTVAANQLNREGFLIDVRRALQQSGLEPSLLTLEIAESTVMHDVSASAERLEEIKRLGVNIAIDDFGNAYAYRSDLQRLPLDYLKVDRSCLAASDDEDYRNWLLEAILILGRDLSLTVIAKGVENYDQMSSLQTMGCTMAQGLFTGQPLGADAVTGLFEAQAPAAASTPPVIQPL